MQLGAAPQFRFAMRYVSPKEGGRDQHGTVAKRDLANYWIAQDDQFQ